MTENGLLSFHRQRLLHDVRGQLLHHLQTERKSRVVDAMEFRESVLHLQTLDAFGQFCDTHYATLTDRSLQLPDSLLRQILSLRDRHVSTLARPLSV